MKKMKFENTDEFERVFKKYDKEITDAIVDGIKEAYKFHKNSNQWEIALESCMDHYRKIDESDAAIDVYLLQKEVRKWLS